MRFAFSDDQLAYRDAVRDLLAKECTSAHVREAWTNATGRIPGLWDQLEAMGVIGMLAPEAEGGLGLTMVDLVLILEETGRHAVPEPIVETAAFGVPLLGRGDIVVGTAQRFVPWADTATVLITEAGRFDPQAVELVPVPSVDGARRLFDLRGPATGVDGDLSSAYHRGVLGNAAQLCGLSDRMLEITAAYVRERKQFGVPVGSFQAVKHHLADARMGWSSPGRLSTAPPPRSTSCTSAWRSRRPPMPRSSRRGPRCNATVRSATRPSTTCTST